MEGKPGLDDLRLFLAVADAGSLGGAARKTESSAPTLSRRMAALERQIGARLFERGRHGYRLTAQGRALADEVADLRGIEARLARFALAEQRPRVRITAGTWTAAFLARHLSQGTTGWVPELLASEARVDIARREADIGIRNRRPEQSWLAGRATFRVRYAVFGAAAEVTGFIALPRRDVMPLTQAWIYAEHPDAVRTTASDPRLMRDMAEAGLGRVVLPVFAATPRLVRLSPDIAELAHDEWLVAHHDGRHDPPVRAALDEIAALLGDRTLRPVQ